ncbi:MAG: hypothetical protein IJA10_13125 [Lachnospiraceae bacterium]|nr:hypothetical protein [Lachnospiraceae bacterium]
MEKRRVVVTGIGTVNAIGNCVKEFWEHAKKGTVGIRPITSFDTTDFKVKLEAEVKNLDMKNALPAKFFKRSERFVHLALVAAQEAMEDSGLCMEKEDSYRVGVCVSSAIGGLSRIAKESLALDAKGPNKVNPFTVPLVIANMASSNIAMMYGIQGKSYGLVSACSSGTDSIGAIIMGSGMSLVMTDIGETLGMEETMTLGIVIGVIGMFMAIINYPILKKILSSRRKKYADKIIALSDEIIKG